MRSVLIAVCFLLLAGCAATTHIDKQWVNQFKYDQNAYEKHWTEARLQQDQEACQDSAFYLARGAFFMDKAEYERLYKNCMEEDRGWSLSKTDENKIPTNK
jgi:hypothetical protein